MTYNKYIESIDNDKCMDCGSSKIIIEKDKNNQLVKRCLVCGKEYYI